MPNWPRTIASRLTTPPEFPEGFAQYGQSGKGQFRAFENTGRVWQEIYSSIEYRTQAGRELLTAINQAQREKIIWDIQHPHLLTNFGVGGGTPLVNGAGQTGDTLVIDGAGTNVTNWLRKGDIINWVGDQLIYDVNGDVNTDGGGNASIPIHPPIFTGQSPANNAPVEIDPTNIFFKAVITSVFMPDIEINGVLFPGLTINWREQPSV